MKKYLFLCMAAIAALLAFTSCSDDDEIDPDDINPDNVAVGKAKFTETANQMVLTYTVSVLTEKVNMKHTATFKDDLCNSFISEATYSKEQYARQSYEDAIANKTDDDQTVYSYKGKVFIEDDTYYYKGQTKDQVRQYLKYLEEAYK